MPSAVCTKQFTGHTLAHGAWHDDGAPQARELRAIDASNAWPLGQTPLLG